MNARFINVLLIPILLFPLLAQNYTNVNVKADLKENYSESSNRSKVGDFFFTTFAGRDKITLRWKIEEEKHHRACKILRSEGDQGSFALIRSYETSQRLSRWASLTNNTRSFFVDLAVAPGITYWYKLICIDSNDEVIEHGPISATIPIHQQASGDAISVSPKSFRFRPIHNSSQTVSSFRLDLPTYFESNHPAKISIYDSQGEPLKTIYNGSLEAGSYQLVWKGDTEKGNIVTEGVFIAVFENDLVREATKLILIK